MNKRIIQVVVLIILITTSCEKVLLKKDPSNDPVTNFDLLWQTLDKQYAFFTYKHVDWNNAYQTYRPLVTNDMSDKALFKVMNDMLYLLKDGHTNLISPFDVSHNWSWYLNSPSNFDYDIIERRYLGSNYALTGSLINSTIDSIGYIYYGSFESPVSGSDLDLVLQQLGNVKGIIIDVRDNTGGNTQNIESIASRFTNHTVLTQYWLYKSGPQHDQFSSPEGHYLNPGGVRQFTGNVAVLTDRKCFSACNDFVCTMKALPNVVTIGDTTGGGGGLPFNSELPNGWKYRFSSTMTLAGNGFNIESGIPPDYEVNMSAIGKLTGKDDILDYAIKLLKNK